MAWILLDWDCAWGQGLLSSEFLLSAFRFGVLGPGLSRFQGRRTHNWMLQAKASLPPVPLQLEILEPTKTHEQARSLLAEAIVNTTPCAYHRALNPKAMYPENVNSESSRKGCLDLCVMDLISCRHSIFIVTSKASNSPL